MTKKNLEIEALRGVAISMVLIAHCLSIAPWLPHLTYDSITQHFSFGNGVDLFFVISGYVVSKSLLGDYGRGPLTAGDLKVFFAKRAFRILPTSLLWVCLTLLATIFLSHSHQFGKLRDDLREAAYIVGYCYNFYLMRYNAADPSLPAIIFGPYWSLSLEEQFYFILPIILMIAGAKRLWVLLTGLVLIAWFAPLPGLALYRFDGLSLGVLLFLAWRSRAHFLRNIEPAKLVLPGNWIVNGLLVVMLSVAGAMAAYARHALILVSVSGLMLVWLASYGNGHGIKSRVLTWLGARSYALYLVHLPMFRLNIAIWRQIARRQHADITTMNVVPIIISAIALVFLATELNFRFVEKPFIVLGHRIAAGIRKKSVASAGGAHSPQAT